MVTGTLSLFLWVSRKQFRFYQLILYFISNLYSMSPLLLSLSTFLTGFPLDWLQTVCLVYLHYSEIKYCTFKEACCWMCSPHSHSVRWLIKVDSCCLVSIYSGLHIKVRYLLVSLAKLHQHTHAHQNCPIETPSDTPFMSRPRSVSFVTWTHFSEAGEVSYTPPTGTGTASAMKDNGCEGVVFLSPLWNYYHS